ncbi:MAG: energy-coupling factor ABC transporter ATP-binding protein [Candidatus Nanoarchaeia archaeon]|nr:energy-coupling factor ABC transporter ATP-binding protein [Candidatus Nanoarchaeia archaeon]MDD5054326.1 energy-coupling factor ABC transporter ATP-binding protein [Candidatus Nanoarchaeia archaeon]MDD5499337.1 energy-coupling factor ABC transporter ATP-binding protein [Candidatus Nanoarchaeia archaeon]
MTPIISAKKICFEYFKGIKVLKNINFEINKGEVVAIIGQNGSGKTTLVKHFNGLLSPTKGEIIVKGEPTLNKTVAQLSRISGYVFQNPDDQIFNSVVEKEVAFGPSNIGLKGKELKDRVNNALNLVGLFEKRKMHPLDLDLNQKKLVAIASMIAMKPDLLMLDEPTTGQDHAGLIRVENLINELRKDYTVIIISHDMNLVSRVASRIVMMCEGEILFDGEPKKAFTKNALLKKTYLKPPVITELAQSLKGFKKDILTVDEFMEDLMRIKKKKK